jgi:hypothetical protein
MPCAFVVYWLCLEFERLAMHYSIDFIIMDSQYLGMFALVLLS